MVEDYGFFPAVARPREEEVAGLDTKGVGAVGGHNEGGSKWGED